MADDRTVGQGDYVVEDGEGVDSIGYEQGYFPDTIWNHPANAEIKRVRVDRNVLLAGDRLTIPPKQLRTEKLATGKTHRFKRKGVPSVFRVQLAKYGKPRANEDYVLTVDGVRLRGTTDAQGRIEQFVPPDAGEGELLIGDEAYTLSFGTVAPITEALGVQQRLKNLGFDCGELSGDINAATQAALAAFQRLVKLDATGELDAATRDKLEAAYDKTGG